LTNLEKLDCTHIIPGHGEVIPKIGLTYFRGYLVDLIAAVKKASADVEASWRSPKAYEP